MIGMARGQQRGTVLREIRDSISDLFSDGRNLYLEATDIRNNKAYMRYRDRGFEPVTLDEYYKSRYGKNHKLIRACFKDLSTSRAIGPDGSVYVCYYQESVICQFDRMGTLVRRYEEMGKVDRVHDIAVHGDSIWCAYPTSHTIKRFSLKDGKLEVSLSEGEFGSDHGTIFSYPERLSIHGDTLYVSDMGNERVCRVDLDTLVVECHVEMTKPVYGFERLGNKEFVLSGSKLYLL
jgi:hypothetical protein